MTRNMSLEERLESIGEALRARPRLTDRVMEDIRGLAADGATERPPHAATMSRRRKVTTIVAGAAATVGAALLIVVALLPAPTVGWADVATALQSQKWIHGSATSPDGNVGEMWLSPGRRIWAFRFGNSRRFFDGRERAKYACPGQGKPITKLPLGEEDAQRILPIEALSQDKDAIGSWLFDEKIVQQRRREVNEDGKIWIEFQMVLWRGAMNQATLRVDPQTRLPIYLLLTEPDDKTRFFKWEFDYPAEGPTDIFALGVPRDTPIEDRMPSADAQRVLDALAANRARIGDFQLIVSYPPANVIGPVPFYTGSIVSRKGDRWRIDSCQPELKISPARPLYICDGTSVFKNKSFLPNEKPRWQLSRNPAPQDLMSGEGHGDMSLAQYVKFASLIFPNLSPIPGWGFEFDPAPADAPGLVLIKRSARLASAEPRVGHEWYYIDPSKGHAVVRMELFNLPLETPADPEASQQRQTIRMEDFKKSSRGFWYPTGVFDSVSPTAGNDQQGHPTVRYDFNFDADLPDALFIVNGVPGPRE